MLYFAICSKIVDCKNNANIYKCLNCVNNKSSRKEYKNYYEPNENKIDFFEAELKEIKVPKECYEKFGNDLDGCSKQENQGCGGCPCLE